MKTLIKQFGLLIPSLALLSFPAVNGFTNMINDSQSIENRQLAKKPEVSLRHLDPFPLAFEAYFNDHFNLRNRLVSYFNSYKINCWNKIPNPHLVYLGKDNWMFNKGDDFELPPDKNLLTDSEKRIIKDELERRAKWLKERHCEFYFLIAPSKHTLYADKIRLPGFKKSKSSIGQDLNKILMKYSSVNVIDVFSELKSRRDVYPIYFKYDHHWTGQGAYFAAEKSLKTIHAKFPSVNQSHLESVIFSEGANYIGSCLRLIGDTTYFKEPEYYAIPQYGHIAKDVSKRGYIAPVGFPYPHVFELVKETNRNDLPSAMIVSDSFGEFIFPHLADHFSRTIKIYDNWEYKLNDAIVESEKPSIFILVMYEANLKKFIEHLQNGIR